VDVGKRNFRVVGELVRKLSNQVQVKSFELSLNFGGRVG